MATKPKAQVTAKPASTRPNISAGLTQRGLDYEKALDQALQQIKPKVGNSVTPTFLKSESQKQPSHARVSSL